MTISVPLYKYILYIAEFLSVWDYSRIHVFHSLIHDLLKQHLIGTFTRLLGTHFQIKSIVGSC